jgi:hypothetical protein
MTRGKQSLEEAKNRFSNDRIHPISKVYAFIEGAEWEHKRLVEKACEWLRRNYTNYMINDLSKYVEDVCSFDIFDDLLVENFRKAMEE